LDSLHQKINNIGGRCITEGLFDEGSIAIEGKSLPRSPANSQQPDVVNMKRISSWPAVEENLTLNFEGVLQSGNTEFSEEWLVIISRDFSNQGMCDETPTSQLPIFLAALLRNDSIDELCRAYFSCIHCLYPVIDQKDFENNILPRVRNNCFAESDQGSALVLLVLALGSVVHWRTMEDLSTGGSFKRGSRTQREPLHPIPGLPLMTEAAKRIGIHLTGQTLTLLQCYILSA
jgi:hypothetical protein